MKRIIIFFLVIAFWINCRTGKPPIINSPIINPTTIDTTLKNKISPANIDQPILNTIIKPGINRSDTIRIISTFIREPRLKTNYDSTFRSYFKSYFSEFQTTLNNQIGTLNKQIDKRTSDGREKIILLSELSKAISQNKNQRDTIDRLKLELADGKMNEEQTKTITYKVPMFLYLIWLIPFLFTYVIYICAKKYLDYKKKTRNLSHSHANSN